jgi:hypothetical protein
MLNNMGLKCQFWLEIDKWGKAKSEKELFFVILPSLNLCQSAKECPNFDMGFQKNIEVKMFLPEPHLRPKNLEHLDSYIKSISLVKKSFTYLWF